MGTSTQVHLHRELPIHTSATFYDDPYHGGWISITQEGFTITFFGTKEALVKILEDGLKAIENADTIKWGL